jgi:hypothetical protein
LDGNGSAGDLFTAFCANNKDFHGFEKRYPDFWTKKIKFHYYKRYSQYFLITDTLTSFSSYIIASINSYPGRKQSIDVLEYAFGDANAFEDLISGLQQMGEQSLIETIRFPAEKMSETAFLLTNNGFIAEEGFSILYYPIRNRKDALIPYRYFHFDYA